MKDIHSPVERWWNVKAGDLSKVSCYGSSPTEAEIDPTQLFLEMNISGMNSLTW